ncbi:probable chitinase 10 isoform X2 [Anopheles albimanus]|uniref:probable chitinase 10 isoform X2 n=1 Tax=Anopheles albimanus TaxID=7167 RepID=UPI00163F3BE6|nr:probable chitinase 10 isoform X2 [Anopheles albimanus]
MVKLMIMVKIVEIWTLAVVVVLAVFASPAAAQNIVCYYDSVAAGYRTPTVPQDLAGTNCTHYIYVGVGVTTQGSIRILSNYDTSSGFTAFQALRPVDGSAKLYIQVGTDRESTYSLKQAVSSCLDKLVNNVAIFLEQYNFDGVEIDRRTNDLDKASLARLVIRLRARLYMVNKQLIVSVPAVWNDAYDVISLSLYADMINVHGYNFTGSSSTATALLAPLFSNPPATVVSVNSTITTLLTAGIRRNKINLVLPTYARTYLLASESQRGVGAPATGPGPAGTNTNRAGLLARYEACGRITNAQTGNYTAVDDLTTATRYYYLRTNWLSLETEDALAAKVTYVKDNRLAGAGIFSLELDDVNNTCQAGAFPVPALVRTYLYDE